MSSTLLDQITAAVADEYVVLGQLGENARGSAFLARERAGGHLVVLAVPPAADELTVLGALGDDVPANDGTCTACGYPPPAFTAHCQQCGRAFVLGAVGAHRFTHADVEAAASHAYDVLGEVAHQVGGSLFFVRDRADGRLVALATQQHEDGSQALEAVWDARHGQRVAPAAPSEAATVLVDTGGYAAALPTADPYAEARGVGADPYGDAGGVPFQGAPYDAGSGIDPASADQPPGYPPGFRSPEADDALGAPAARRRWVPVAVAGAVLLAAGGVWAATRDSGQSSAPAKPVASADSVRLQPTLPPAAPPPADSGAGGGASTVPAGGTVAPPAPPPPARDSVSSTREQRRAQEDSIRRLRFAPAYVKLEGDIPAGLTVNGRRAPQSLTVPLRSNRVNVLTLDAPGYCPKTVQVPAVAPGAVEHLEPRLEGRSGIRDCPQ